MHKTGFFIAILVVCAFTPACGDYLDIIKMVKDVVIFLSKTFDLVDEHFDFGEVPIPFLERTERKLFNKISIVNTKLDFMSAQVDTVGTQTISTILRNLPERVRLELRLNDLLDYITRTNIIYRHMQQYVNISDIERVTLEDFAASVVAHDGGSVRSLVERIHAFVSPSGKGIANTGIISLLRTALETHFENIGSFPEGVARIQDTVK